jgi:hypothetical protein
MPLSDAAADLRGQEAASHRAQLHECVAVGTSRAGRLVKKIKPKHGLMIQKIKTDQYKTLNYDADCKRK